MKNTRKCLALVLASVLLLCAVLTGCDGGGTPGGTPGVTPAPTPGNGGMDSPDYGVIEIVGEDDITKDEAAGTITVVRTAEIPASALHSDNAAVNALLELLVNGEDTLCVKVTFVYSLDYELLSATAEYEAYKVCYEYYEGELKLNEVEELNPIVKSAAEEEIVKEFVMCLVPICWTLDDTGTLAISGSGRMEDYELGTAPWYEKRNAVKSVVVEDGMENIGAAAFANCTNLVSITLPDSVTRIGMGAFISCSSLTDITLPEGIISIENYTFKSCTSLESITIPESVTTIKMGAFYGCESLTSVTIPVAMESIGNNAFNGCSNLAEVFYGGTEDDWNNLVDSIGKGNSDLLAVDMIYFAESAAEE